MSTYQIRRPSWVSDRLVEDPECGPYAQFQMYSKEGNDEVAKMVLSIVDAIETRPMLPRDIPTLLDESIKALAEKHGEVYDTEPRGAILDALNEYLVPNGYAALEEFPF